MKRSHGLGLQESLEQQAALAEVLRVMSSSRGELDPVFAAVLENSTRICEAQFGNLWLRDGDNFRIAATHGAPQSYREFFNREPIVCPDPRCGRGLIVQTKQPIHIEDVRSASTYRDRMRDATITLANARSLVAAPLLKDNDVIGAIAIYRQEVRPFTGRQIEALSNFAAQVVIAIENARLLNELRQRTDDLTEALEQQTGTTNVLRAISSSPGELEPLFNSMLENATRICEASFGVLFSIEDEPTASSSLVRVAGAKAALAVPMLHESELVGALIIYRDQPGWFTDKQAALLTNFAAQAVIAIENARLLDELRQRTADLTESLEQQTATSDVLRVISSSQGKLDPVFDAMLENAVRLCDAKFGVLFLYDGKEYRSAALHSAARAYAQVRQHKVVIRHTHPEVPLTCLARTKEVIQIADVRTEPCYIEGDPTFSELVDDAGARTLLVVPMLKEDELVGAFAIYRQEVRAFAEKQVQLVQNFVAQAVIAIENVRLFEAEQQRSRELGEALERQTATADVLRVLSSSAFDLQTVFVTLLETAMRLCESNMAAIWRAEGDVYKLASGCGMSGEFEEFARANPIPPGRGSVTGRAALEGKTVHIPDVCADPEFAALDYQSRGNYRCSLGVPLLREGHVIGVFNLTRLEPRPYTQSQIELVQNFAAQAVVAIENVRLLHELRESLRQQTATPDVLKVISRSTFDLKTVLQTLVESAARLCDADKATITRQIGDRFYRAESFGFSAEFMNSVINLPVIPERTSATGRALLEGRTVHIPDVHDDPAYKFVEALKFGDFRTVLGVPMLREGIPIGVFALTRAEVRPFTEKQVELVSTFANQAVIAIENARLFGAEQQRTQELAKSLDDLRTAQDRLVQTEKLASLGQLTAGIAHEIKNPPNFVNNFYGVSVELIDELQETLRRVTADQKTREEISELADTLRENLDKIVQHGRRADSIVKNMLLHSRQGSGEHRPVDINALVEESLNLAYHGVRAEKQGFNITLERSFDPAAGEIDAFPQEISRVLLNLISNGFYAAGKRREQTGGYKATLTAATRSLGDRVEIRIRDNGTGIPPEVREKMFNPFFTTKPAGEGTGLGLSISHDIIVKQHGGSIEVETRPGEFTEFKIVLPRKAA